MATGNPKPPTRTAADKAKQQAVLDRMQRDLDGYIDQYQDILDKRAQQYAKDIAPTWQKIGAQLEQAIEDLYNKYADENGALDGTRLRELEQLTWLRKHVSNTILALNGDVDKLRNNLSYTYADSAIWHTWGLEQATKLAVVTPALTNAHIMGILANPWLPDGATYSDRLRANTTYLAIKMKDTVTEAVGQGWDVQKAARRITEVAGEGYHNSVRLARTEINRVSSQASSHVFMQNADILDGKRWRATLDARTAPKDGANDGKVYELDYDTPERPGRAGERIPNHPNCRCKYSPVISGVSDKVRERIARGDGDTETEFGERTYTKAKDYREYAKERGLPDLDERLAKENPTKYLRQGEGMAAYTIPSGEVTKTQATTQAKTAVSGKKTAPKKPAVSAVRPADKLRQEIPAGMLGSAETASTFFEMMDNAPTDFVEFTRKYFKKGVNMVIQAPNDGCYYAGSDRNVYMSAKDLAAIKAAKKDTKDYIRSSTTLIHEIGHGLDYGIEFAGGATSPRAASMQPGNKFKAAIDTAVSDFQAKFDAKAKQINRSMTPQERRELMDERDAAGAYLGRIAARLRTDLAGVVRQNGQVEFNPQYAGLSDIFDGITGKQINGGYGHGADYWKNNIGAVYKEAFANMYEMYVSNNWPAIEFLEGVMPGVAEAFLEMIKNA